MYENSKLTDLGDFPVLQTIGGNFQVWNHRELTDLGDFSVLQTIGGYFYVSGNSDLTDLGDFPVLQTIGGYFLVFSNNELTDLGDFPVLDSIGGLFYVRENSKLTDLGDFPVLETIGGYFSVWDNDTLTSLGNFPALTSIGVGNPIVPSLGRRTNNVSIVVEYNSSLSDCYTLTDFLPGGDHAVSGEMYINNNAGVCTDQSALSNTIYRGDITVTTQAEVNALSDTLAGKTRIDGNLTIEYSYDITDLTPLSNMTHITGNLRIQQNGQLANLNGLDSLQTIGGYLIIGNNTELQSLGDFSALTSIGSGNPFVPSESAQVDNVSILVEGNPNLFACCDLVNFLPAQANAVSGRIFINNNSAGCNLATTGTDAEKADALSSVCGTTTFTLQSQINTFDFANATAKNIVIGPSSGSDPITNISRLSTITSLLSLTITGNEELQNLVGLSAFTQINGNISVENNPKLQSLGDFSALTRIGGELNINNNEKLQSLGDLSALTSIGEFFNVSFQPQLTTLGDFPVLQTIGEYFHVTNNDTLTDLGDFPALTSIGVGSITVPSSGEYTENVSIVVEDNSSLSDCYTLTDFLQGGAHVVSGGIYINDNATNGGCNSQNGIINPIYTGDIIVSTQAEVDSLRTTLAGKTIIDGNVFIGYGLVDDTLRSDITDLTPLSNVSHITGTLFLRRNGSLVNLNGLTHLQTIGGNFRIGAAITDHDHTKLTTLGTFPALQTIGGLFSVLNNDALTDLGDFPVLQTIGGGFWMEGNDTLTDLGTFPALQTIGEWFYVVKSDLLTSLGNFPVLQTVGGYFRVQNNAKLTDLGDFSVLQSIGGYFYVTNNDTLTTLGNFPVLTSIGVGSITVPSLGEYTENASIVVENNSSLSDCYTLTDFLPGGDHAVSGEIYINNNAGVCTNQSALSNTIYRGNITVTTQAAVNDLSTTLAGKTRIDGNLTIGSSSDITDLTPLSNIVRITGNLTIQQNGQLANLNALTHLQTIGGFFAVTSHSQLTDLGDFPALTSIGVGDAYVPSLNGNRNNVSIVVEDNSSLSDCYTLTDFLPGGSHAVSGGIYINNNAGVCTNQNALSNTIYTGSITVTTQTAVDALSDTLAGKTIIDGTLTIGYTNFGSSRSDITDLTPLSNMTHVTGYVWIQQNDQLANLTGLNSLQTIGGYFDVTNNDTLTTLGYFPVLQTIGGYFDVTNNDTLTTLGNFPVLTSIGVGSITVPSLGEYTDNVSIVVEDNSSLSDCYTLTDFLPGGSHAVSGGIYINNNAGVCTNQSALTNTIYRGDITVTTQAAVDSLRTTLAGKTRIDGNLTIGYTDFGSSRTHITDLTLLSNMTHITGNLIIQQNGQLANLNALTHLQTIGGSFYVGNNNELTDLGNFPVLQTIGKIFLVDNNGKLTDLGDFPALQTIGRNFRVYNNAELTDLGDFPILQTIGGYLNVNTNAELTDLGDFPILQTIGGYFRVLSNGELTDLGDFPVLQSIGGYFYVYDNDTLTSLGNFPALTSIGVGSITVPSLDEYTENVSIVVVSNSSLSDCYMLTDFLPGGVHAVSGGIFISNNALGCNSGGEIKASAPHTIMLTSHTDGDSIAIAYDEVVAQTIMFSIGGSATGWTSEITGDDFITLDPFANVSDTGVAITVRATPTDENTGTDERSAVITFTTMGGTRAAASTRVTITQAALPDDVYIGDITVSTQAEVDSLRTTLAGKTVIDGKVLIGYGLSGDTLRSDITDLTPLSNVSHITGNLIIQRNGSLVNLNGLTHLQTIGGNFRIGAIFTENSNAQLTALGYFSVLQTIGGYFSVQNNDTLTDLGDFPVLRSIGGFFNVYNNAQLTALGDFPVLRSIGEYFNVYNNAQLTDLGNFSVLRSIGEYFNVYNNAQLTDLGDFPVLRTIGEYFNVTNNDTLTALGKFPALTSIGVGSITVPSLDEYTEDVSILVEDNSSLSDCYTLTDLLPGGSHTVSGGIYINNNALGCSSGDEIIMSAPHTIKLISHTDGDSIAIAYNDVDPQIITFEVGGGATGWTSEITGDDFITLDPFANVADTGVAIMVRATPTDENTGVARIAVITLTTMGGTGAAASARVTITQLEAPSSHILKIISPSRASDTVAYTATPTSDSVEIAFTVGNALGWESMISYGDGVDEFITLSETDNAAQVGEVTIKAAVTKNEGVERSAVITIMTRGGTGAPATATVMITQDGAPPTIRLISKNREALAYDATTETAIMFEVGGRCNGLA